MAAHVPNDREADAARQALRRRLLTQRLAFAGQPEAHAARESFIGQLKLLLTELEPASLGLYWPMRGEFNAIEALDVRPGSKLALALPFAQRQPPAMHYRVWDGSTPAGVDECGLPTPPAGPPVVPEVVLVPCVAFTRSGYRLGYGGGYFDRWLAQHPGVTTIGVAWSQAEVSEAEFAPRAHDRTLTLVLTERGVVS